MIAIYPGSFDPVTYGHIDIIKRTASLTDKLIIGVLNNANKKNLFTAEERIGHLKRISDSYKNVEVIGFTGLLLDFFVKMEADAIIRGVRSSIDFENEYMYASAYININEKVQTLFIPADPKFLHISSSMVKEAASFGGDVSSLVPAEIAKALQEKYAAWEDTHGHNS